MKAIPGYPGYFVNEEGRVFSTWRQIVIPGRGRRSELGAACRELCVFDRKSARGDPTAYRSVCLSSAGRRRTCYVHELVMLAFVGPRPSPEHEICHGNGDGADNRAANLRYGTVSENVDDKRRHGSIPSGADHWRARDRDEHAFADLLGVA